MDNLQQVGERIKLQRTKHNKTQRDICNAIHIEQVTLSQYETNKRTPKLEILIALADLFHVSVDYLLGRTEECQYESSITIPTHEDLPEKSKIMLKAFEDLDEDNQDIIIGEIKKLLKQQRRDLALITPKPLKKVP